MRLAIGKKVSLIGLAALAFGASPGQAQVATPNLPTRQEITPPAPEPAGEARAQIDARDAFQQGNCPFATSALRVTVSRVAFTRPDGSALQPQIADALADLAVPSGDQPVAVVCEIRDQANAALRRKGWIASVQIPAQEIADGVLRLEVVTARLVEVRVRGDAGRYEPLLRRRLAKLQAMDPLNEREAERLLLLAGDVPGLDVALSLRASGGAQGDVIGDLTVSSRRFALFANAQNYNSRLLGRETLYARGEIYGLTGLADITYLGVSTTADFQEQIILQGGHIFELDNNGTTLGSRVTYAWSRPDLGPLDLRTNTLIAGFDLTRPLVRSIRSNARVRGGFDFVDQIARVGTGDTAVTLTRDRLRVAFVGLDADHQLVDANGNVFFSIAASAELRKGLSIFNASERGFASGELTSRLDGNPRAVVFRGTVDASLRLGPVFSIAALGQAQWANDPLLNYEEFALGSLTVGRGYDPGSNSADRAVGGRFELRADPPISSRLGTQVYGFYDRLHLRNLDRATVEGPRTFDSVGGGLRLSLPGSVVLDVAYAKPLDKALLLDERRPPGRVLVSLTLQLRDRAR
ncbi:ShlB/FhaC/HecB family hemolysin secretion/activation protein [Sphingomonas sp. NBWT7]|uniref:ShlB/FhaC/HecB family hemolysin secretion/activation protein n=1 Tax=Sphingomonas sp. NBWT7 TaxID=2596913 RepID=UPI00162A5BD2|nr:ShlB/FhaC/HecB family hemolysin secretion/activation protein [Sphingomonas sp. NBWT7]QNE32472.1 ShlB/FhaC/HecB family hemolysin secretion/activation protein [Sphingomonas sp. NBWT7]